MIGLYLYGDNAFSVLGTFKAYNMMQGLHVFGKLHCVIQEVTQCK